MKHFILSMGLAVSSYVFATGTTPTEIQKCEIIEQVGTTEEYNAKVDIIKATSEQNQAIVIEGTFTLGQMKYNGFDVSGAIGRVAELGNGSGSLATSAGPKFISISIDATYLTSINKGSLANFDNVTSFKITNGNTPAIIQEGAVPEAWATSCALTVPEAAKDAYLAAWGSYFKSINGETIDHTATAVEEIEEGAISAKVVGNKIVISEEAPVTVYSITGKVVFLGIAETVEVNGKGIYIVKTPTTTSKVVVK